MDKITSDNRILAIRDLTQTIDIHVHPLDVIGVCEHFGDENRNESFVLAPAKLGFSQKYNFNRLINSLTKLSFSIAPSVVRSSILEYYQSLNIKQILHEMDCAGIDRSFFVPIEPYVSNKETLRIANLTERASSYASFDVHNYNSTINIKSYFNKNNFIGIKMHPNLQGFLPIVDNNSDEIVRVNLTNIYRFAESNSIPLLFHAGKSYILNNPRNNLSKSILVHRSSNNGLLKNFFQNGKFIFKNINFPVILAHLGSYASAKLDIDQIHKISMCSNVYFDTAGINPAWITQLLNFEPKTKIIFGSDAYYYSQKYTVLSVFEAIQRSELSKHAKDEVIIDTFGKHAERIF